MALVAYRQNIPLEKFGAEWGIPPGWENNHVPTHTDLHKFKLLTILNDYAQIKFDHIQVGVLGRKICVFVVKGDQSTVLYDKTRNFPSAKLMASLVLLGTP